MFRIPPIHLDRIELAVKLGQKKAKMPRSFDFKLQQRFFVAKVVLI